MRTEPAKDDAWLAEWIERGARGDEAACAALFHEFYPSVVRLSLGLLNDLADAEEVAQDTFVYALSNLGRYDARRSAFRTWLFTIALSRCRNKRRRKLLLQGPLELLAGEMPATPREVETALERRGLRRQLWQALQALSEPVREAVVLRYLGEMRYKEVGAALGCNPKTAESRVRLGVEALRRALTEQGAAPEWQWSEAPA
ncbi:MAG: sigma-70 family RNA polymerase sigma factor [Anaerolineales bacterium]|nr:sigma-70 family RNA polymerase sigma factor [Anaerolineales bacterium]